MLESLLLIQSDNAPTQSKSDITFKTSSATATMITILPIVLGYGFTTHYSIDGSPLTPLGDSLSIPAGDHEITLKLDVVTGSYLNLQPFSSVLTEVTDWEGFQLSRIVFTDCTKLTKVPDYLPAVITETHWMFRGCTAFNQDIGDWDTSRITNMSSMFSGCANFNQDIGIWDVSQVTDMSDMFSGCSSFNQDISRWNVGNVTNMSYMFYGCSSFNQDIGGWDTSNVTNMHRMFFDCSSFNQDISGWNVGNVTNMAAMFTNCTSFNQDLSSMVFKSTVTRTNYALGATAWDPAYRPQFTG